MLLLWDLLHYPTASLLMFLFSPHGSKLFKERDGTPAIKVPPAQNASDHNVYLVGSWNARLVLRRKASQI